MNNDEYVNIKDIAKVYSRNPMFQNKVIRYELNPDVLDCVVLYTKELHYETFDYMAQRLSPYIDRCIFSFVEMYKKLQINMPEIILLTENDKNEIAKNIGSIAKKHNLIIQTYATDENFENYGILHSGCMTTDILGKANNITFKKLKLF